jgi:alanyl-tRNA synthetase
VSTRKLFFSQQDLIKFPAKIIRTFPHESYYAVILDQTAFYPTSGGQMHDTGTINDIEVVDVIEQDGEILHLLNSPLNIGAAECKINWKRRFDFMQQHTGFHILARSFLKVTCARTLSSHLGEQISTIDVDLQEISEEQIKAVEDLVHQIIFEDRKVKTYFSKPADVDKNNLRKELTERDDIRLVEIENFDVDPCGGTHVNSTGQVGLIKIIRWEKIRGYLRFEFYAGGRAIQDYHRKWQINSRLSNLLSTGEDEFVGAVEKLQTESKDLIRKNKKLTEQNIIYEARELVQQAQQQGKNVIAILFENRQLDDIRYLAKQVIQFGDVWALFGLNDEKAHLIFARSDSYEYNLNELVKQVAHLIEGRGGGRPNFVEIGGPKKSSLEEALNSARVIVEKSVFSL